MKIALGSTRMVFIFSNSVIKIPRIRISLFLRRFFLHSKNGEVNKKINELNIDLKYITRYLLQGFGANLVEYRYSKKTPQKFGIIPVKFLILGFILVQPRGDEVAVFDKRLQKALLLCKERNVLDEDMTSPHNYSIWQDQICLHDYGSVRTIAELNKYT